ncbi:hypothetical protein [Cellulophaga sp. Z1A5H]|uniref:hypothetical protein n=1 Tax=Cellulophaga sp. Z1A5H TaxID=2687291 RepID=UPI0013FD884A|nr:hypothetical protein [Cellulophaga sp. Z1A5H]
MALRFSIFLVCILSWTFLFSQKVANYETLDGSYFGKRVDMYITKSKDTLRIGDTLTIGKMSNENHYQYINQANQFAGSQLSGHKIIIKKLIVEKANKNRQAVLWVDFRGWGLYPVFISYEQASEAGEVIVSNSKMTREQAIDELKEAKDLLELEVISKDEYNKLKERLTPIIMN